MQDLILIKTLTAALHKNATCGNKNSKLAKSLLSAIECLADKEFASELHLCNYHNVDWSEIVRQYKERLFLLETKTELVKAFEGVVYRDYEIGKALSDENPHINGYGTFNPRAFWPLGLTVEVAGPKTGLARLKFKNNFISERSYVAFCEVDHFTLPNVVEFEATTPQELAVKIKDILDRSWAAHGQQ